MVSLTALVAGCASYAVPSSAPLAQPQNGAVPSLLFPLLYVADLGKSDVVVESYPHGKHKFTLSSPGSVNGLCTNFDGNVYVSDGHDGELIEFEYGTTKQLRVLKDPGYYLGGCAVEIISGDVAVAIQPTNSDPGGVAIFRHGKGKPHNYTGTSTYFASNCTYDNKGNLYVDGTVPNSGFFVAELPAKKHVFSSIMLDQSIPIGGGIQWDGARSLLAVDDQGVGYKGSTIYEFAIDGSTATEKGSTPLGGSTDVIGFDLFETGSGLSRIIGANIGTTPSVMYWPYPKGGHPSKTITGFTEPVAVVVASEPSALRR
jgi:hypothetical protein